MEATLPVRLASGFWSALGATLDVSRTGVFALCAPPMNLGRLDLDVWLPGGTKLALRGRAVRAERAFTRAQGLGIELDGAYCDDRLELWLRYVESIESREATAQIAYEVADLTALERFCDETIPSGTIRVAGGEQSWRARRPVSVWVEHPVDRSRFCIAARALDASAGGGLRIDGPLASWRARARRFARDGLTLDRAPTSPARAFEAGERDETIPSAPSLLIRS